MLAAVVSDLQSAGNLEVSILLADDVPAPRTAAPVIRVPTADHHDITNAIRNWCGKFSQELTGVALHPRAILMIAPECDGILDSLLTTAETARDLQPVDRTHATTLVLNLDAARSRVFADKLATCEWLHQRNLPTIPTRPIGRLAAHTLVRSVVDRDQSIPGHIAVSKMILKPRYGVGSDDVRLVSIPETQLPPECEDDHDSDLILQPYISGTACSVGFIGGGQDRLTTILKPAIQYIVETPGRLAYRGGKIPADEAVSRAIDSVAVRLSTAIGQFSGYLGADLIVNPDAHEPVTIVEINPRLCTSYVGYRVLASENLAVRLLQQQSESLVAWKSGSVDFDATGQFVLNSG